MVYGGTGDRSSLDRPEREGAPRTHWKLMVKKKRARYDFVQVGGVHMLNLGGIYTVQYSLAEYTLYSLATLPAWQRNH